MELIHFISSLKNLKLKTIEATIKVFFLNFHFNPQIIKYYVIFQLDVCILLNLSWGDVYLG